MGTTYSAVSYVDEHGTPRMIPDFEGNYFVPSVVFFPDYGNPIVGQHAKDNIKAYPDRVVMGVKRHMGDDNWIFAVDGAPCDAVRISSLILAHLKSIAEGKIGTVRDAVITVPAYFLDKERSATIKAAELAGLNVLGIVNEPTAAALSYGVSEQPREQTMVVYDLGGGTFDVTVMRFSPGSTNRYDVITTTGNHRLGGIDWDEALAEAVDDQFRLQHGCSPIEDPTGRVELLAECEKVKRSLSQLARTKIVFHFAGHTVSMPMDRDMFEEMSKPLLNKTRSELDRALAEAQLSHGDLDLILLVGGSCKMPMVPRMVNGHAREVALSRDPDHCVSLGAAIQAARLALDSSAGGLVRYTEAASSDLRRIHVADVVPHSLGVLAVEGGRLRNKIILPRGNKVPCEAERSDLTTSRDSQKVLEIHVMQGESEEPHRGIPLETYVFGGIAAGPAGSQRFRVTYKYNSNTVVEVTAVDLATKRSLPLETRSMDRVQRLLADDLRVCAGGAQGGAVALLIDASGSMTGTAFDEARQACRQFLDKADCTRVEVGLVQFGMNSSASVVVPLTRDKQAIIAGLERMNADGTTPLTQAIECGRAMLNSAQEGARHLVVFTDGSPDNRDSSVAAAQKAREQGIRIICVGTGDANRDLLGKIASSTSDNYFERDGEALSRTFGDIAEVISGKRLH